MSEPKHTPGPWIPVQLATNIVQIQPEGEPVDGMVICTVESHWDVMPAGRVKDVKLIAAAPELLEALREMVAQFHAYGIPGGRQNAVTQARAAIAKAEGK